MALFSEDATRYHPEDTLMSAVTETTIREALQQVVDPELFVNVVDLGLICKIAIEPAGEQSDVKIEMTMTSPACPAAPQLLSDAQRVVTELEGVDNVDVKLVLSPPWTPDRMSEDAKDQLGIF
jgi:metal-sulfur cluster biosynthetic enzyme